MNVAPEEIQLRIGKKMIDQMSGVSKSATYLAWKGYMNSNARKMAVRNQPNTVLKPTYDYIINKYGQGGNTNNVTVTTLSVLREKGGSGTHQRIRQLCKDGTHKEERESSSQEDKR